MSNTTYPFPTETVLDRHGNEYTRRVPLNYAQLWDQFKADMKAADDRKRRLGLFGTAPSQSWQDQQSLLNDIKNHHV